MGGNKFVGNFAVFGFLIFDSEFILFFLRQYRIFPNA